MTEQVLDDMKRVLDFRPPARFQMLHFLRQTPQLVLGQPLAFGVLLGHMSRHRFTDVFGALFHTPVAGATERRDFVAVHQRVGLRHVGDIACCADEGVPMRQVEFVERQPHETLLQAKSTHAVAMHPLVSYISRHTTKRSVCPFQPPVIL